MIRFRACTGIVSVYVYKEIPWKLDPVERVAWETVCVSVQISLVRNIHEFFGKMDKRD